MKNLTEIVIFKNNHKKIIDYFSLYTKIFKWKIIIMRFWYYFKIGVRLF